MPRWETVFSSLAWGDIYLALALFAGFQFLGWVFYFVLRRIVKRLVGKSGTNLDNMVLESVEKPVLILMGLVGLYVALVSLHFTEEANRWVSNVFQAAFITIGIYAAVRAVDSFLKWYAVEVAAKTKTAVDDKLVPGVRVAIPVIAGVLGVIAVGDIFELPVGPFKAWLSAHAGRLGLIIVLSVTALFGLGSGVPGAVRAAVGKGKPDESPEEVAKRAETLAGVLVTSGQVLVIFVGVFMLLSEAGVDIAPVLAGAGVAGVAIGFGAQSLIKDIIAGLFVIWENQYRVGDVVKIADTAGIVEEINLRRTVLRDLDGIVHFVPNGEVRVASNLTRGYSRVNLDVSVGYGEDLDRVMAVMDRVGKDLSEDPTWGPFILKTPQVLRVDKLGDSGIDIKMVGDTKPMKQWDVTGELRLRLKRAFDREGIEIPWPHTKVYFGNSPFGPDSKGIQEATRGKDPQQT
ncbi:MAG: mechanosensitive ion channel family protein [Chloroflexi bacterium]|nr:mechanosensitive ion channel family protein [Chloroflexota bacterium]